MENVTDSKTKTQLKKWAQAAVSQLSGNYKLRGGTVDTLTADEWLEILDLYQYTCAYCRVPLEIDAPPKTPRKATFDHVISITDGGRNEKGNVRPACHRCNERKRSTYVRPLPPPGQPRTGPHALPPPPVARVHKKSTREVTAADEVAIITMRTQHATIQQIVTASGLTFNQVVRQLTRLQAEGRVPVIRRGRRSS
jgi:5-methylcytosine-specific restriction endonuclease McrA